MMPYLLSGSSATCIAATKARSIARIRSRAHRHP
jgi:hypothetical protein